MPTKIHFMNVGQGNMTLLQLDNGQNFLYDCNVTTENQNDVLKYLVTQIGLGTHIDKFICSHRDADHMRGIRKIHKHFPINGIWDSGVTGTTPDSAEYGEYMQLRREVGSKEVKQRTYYDCGNTRLRIMNAKNDHLPSNPNAQSIVIKVVQRDNYHDKNYASVFLTGDTDAITWKNISNSYCSSDLTCSLLLASHHGSITYFDDPTDDKYYITHLKTKSPHMTIISVGDNGHGHPNNKAMEFYTKYSSGSKQGNKVCRTDKHGHICATLQDSGSWSLTKQFG